MARIGATIRIGSSSMQRKGVSYGANLVVNGGFDTASNWAVSGSMTQVITGGVWSGSGASGYGYSDQFYLEAGTYEFEYSTYGSLEFSHVISINQRFGGYATVYTFSYTRTAWGTTIVEVVITAPGNHRVQLTPSSVSANGGTMYADNISLRKKN